MADADGSVVMIDDDDNDYVCDKGPVTALGLDVNNDPASIWFHTLRVFGFKKGYAVATGVPGRYLVNSHRDTETNSAAQALSLPALMHFHDSNNAAVIGLSFKISSNGRIYVRCVPTDLKISANADGQDKWISDDDVLTRRLDLFSKCEALVNTDGFPLAKRFDDWLKNHSTYFKDRNMRSLAACRAWLAHSKYIKQMATAATLAQQDTRAAIFKAHGLSLAPGGRKKTPAIEAQYAAAEVDAKAASATLQQAAASLGLAVKAASVAVGGRIIEAPFDPDAETSTSAENLQRILHQGAPDCEQELLERLKDNDKLELLRSFKATTLVMMSPLPKAPAPPEPAPAAEIERPETNEGSISEHDEMQQDEQAVRVSSRPKSAPVRLDGPGFSTAPSTSSSTSGKRPRASSLGTSSDYSNLNSSNEAEDGIGFDKRKRSYQKSGLFTKEKLLAARNRSDYRKQDHPPKDTAGEAPCVYTFVVILTNLCCAHAKCRC